MIFGIVLDDAFAVKVCLMAPLLYLSLAMTIDPPGFIERLSRQRVAGLNPAHDSVRARGIVRLTGLCLMALILYVAS
jgi:hypothetical protein